MRPLSPNTDLTRPGCNNNNGTQKNTLPTPQRIPSPERPNQKPPAPTRPGTESTVGLVNHLVEHVGRDWTGGRWGFVRDTVKEEAQRKKLKILAFSVLLSHRKDYDRESCPLRLTELEEVMWQGFLLRQHHRHDDANALDTCLNKLRDLGHLEVGSEVRNVMRFLVALKGRGGSGATEGPPLAKITPRILNNNKDVNYLPSGPLHYGETFLQSGEYRPHYMHFPTSLFSRPTTTTLARQTSGIKGGKRVRSVCSSFVTEDMMALSKATPGTGINPLLVGADGSVHSGKVMGALVQERQDEVTPDTLLTIPELPIQAKGYVHINLPPTPQPTPQPTPRHSPAPSTHSAVASDEGYASSRAGHPDSPGPEEGCGGEQEEALWKEVVGGPPLPARRTWETLSHIPTTLEKPFLSESGPEASHNVWLVYQDLWGSLQGQRPPPLYVRSPAQISQDLLNLMIGVPSHSFTFIQESETFLVAEGLCHPGITPEHLLSSLTPFLQCGALVHRLEVLCSGPQYDVQEIYTKGAIFRAFTVAITNFLQVYRGWVFSLGGKNHVARLQQKAQPLLRKVRFVANICKLTPHHPKNGTAKNKNVDGPGGLGNDNNKNGRETDTTNKNGGENYTKNKSAEETDTAALRDKPSHNLPRGLSLLGELLNHMLVTKDRECLLILVSIFNNACVPFFRYLEDWVYRGCCDDPGQEFMVEMDGEALLRRDREYWTRGYTLRTQYHHHHTDTTTPPPLPPLLTEVLEEAFTCGKAINLLRICSRKHHLVEGGQRSHPRLQLCTSRAAVDRVRASCLAHAAHMDHLAAQHQVTIQQKAERERDERQQLVITSTRKHTAAIQAIENKMAEVCEVRAVQKRSQLKELKKEMEKAQERKKEVKEREVEEEKVIARQLEETHAKKDAREQKLKDEMEEFYRQKLKVAERTEALAHWRVQRCQLGEERKHFIHNTTWTPTVDGQHKLNPLDEHNKEAKEIEEYVKPEEIVEGVIPVEVSEVATPNEVLEGATRDEVLEGATPDEVLEGGTPDEGLKITKDLETPSTNEDVFSPTSVRDDDLLSPVSADLPCPQRAISRRPFSIKPRNMSPGSSLKDQSPGDCRFTLYPGQVDIRESPNQEVSSVSEMTASLMSTSSDFIDTPFDENLPDFDVDPRRPNSSNSYIEDKVSPMYTKSSIESILYDKADNAYFQRNRSHLPKVSYGSARSDSSVNKLRVLEEEYGITSESVDSNNENKTKDREGNLNVDGPKSAREAIRDKVLKEEYGMTRRTGETPIDRDDNANFTVTEESATKDQLDTGNRNTTSDNVTERANDNNANISAEEVSPTTGHNTTPNIGAPDDPNANAVISSTQTSDTESKGGGNDDTETKGGTDNDNTQTTNRHELVLEFKERRARAAATREKIMNEEFHYSNANRNNMNTLRSRPVTSSAAAKNKQKVQDTEYGDGGENNNKGWYGRQVSWGSTSSASYRSSSSSGRLSSASTAFNTPDDEERPVLIDQDPDNVVTPSSSESTPPAITPAAELLASLTTTTAAPPYTTHHLNLMGKDPLVDITGTALSGRPRTRDTQQQQQDTTPQVPATWELSHIPTYFIQSIKAHLSIQSDLVQQELVTELVVRGNLLEHFSALRSLLLLHDANFAAAITANLFTKVEGSGCPALVLVPVQLNNVLSRAVEESCWSSNPLTDNLTFAITNIPKAFTHPGSVLECVELQYRVGWPQSIILDRESLQCYSRAWSFLARLHYTIWAADALFSHFSAIGRESGSGGLVRSPQFHQVSLFRHHIHHFLLVIQAYIVSQVHQISWSRFERKMEREITSLDQLYQLHSSLLSSILSRCFLTRNGTVIQKLIQDVLTMALQFRSQVLSHPWKEVQKGVSNGGSGGRRDDNGGGRRDGDGGTRSDGNGGRGGGRCDGDGDNGNGGGNNNNSWQHPAFPAIKSTYQEFQSLATFLHKLLVKVGQQTRMDPRHMDLLNRLDFNRYYSR